MVVDDIEQDLRLRIEETSSWMSSPELPVIDNLEARGTPCTAYAVELIKDEHRKESDGLRFRLELGKPEQRYFSIVEVRIKDTRSDATDGQSIANGPYISVYIEDLDEGGTVCSYFEHFEDAETYFSEERDSISDWYRKWIHRLLRMETGNIIFKYMQRVGE